MYIKYTVIFEHTFTNMCRLCVNKFLIINKLDAFTSQIYFGRKLYMFRTVPLSIIRSFPPYTQQWYMLEKLYDIYHCCLCSEKLLMMDRGTVRNM